MIKEREQPIPVLLEPSHVTSRNFGLVVLPRECLIELLDRWLELAQVTGLQAKAIHGFDDGAQHFSELRPYLLHFVVEGLLVEVIVNIPHKMNQAFLLCTGN